jgi:hypothetical protein
MGSKVRHLTSFGRRRAKAAVIAGAAVGMLCTGTAFAANMTSPHEPTATISHQNAQSRHHNPNKPRTGGGRDAVLLGPGRRVAAGQLVPGRPLLDPVAVH